MRSRKPFSTAAIAVAGVLLVVLILVLGTLWMSRSAGRDTEDAVSSVSRLYLDELAGRREQVVSDNLRENIDRIGIAIGLMTEEDLSDVPHLQEYQKKMKQLFRLEKFAFVDENGLIYTSLGTEPDTSRYAFDHTALSGPEISVINLDSREKKVVIAVPVDRIPFNGGTLVACFMEIDMDVMLEGLSMQSRESDTTFCNIYTSAGIPLSDTVLGGLAEETNLLEALAGAEFKDGNTLEQVASDFAEGKRGTVSFSYSGTREMLGYVPVDGTDWLLTYLVRESVISEQLNAVSRSTITRSVLQSLLAALVLGGMFAFVIAQNRKNAKLALEKETSEAENRARHQEMEHRLALQEQLLEQEKQRTQQENLIKALAADYWSVYYLELDRDEGICYQVHEDLDHGFRVGERFPYLASVTAYADEYITDEYRDEFMRFVQPDSIRDGLKDERVISYRYMVRRHGRETWEMVRFAGVRHPEDREDHLVHAVGACFTNVDAETRRSLAESQALSDALNAAEQANRAKTAFLSNMSHEIRTPMNAIIGLDSIALNDPDISGQTREYLEKIGLSANHLLTLINDILDMSRIESGRMTLKNEEFSFSALIGQINTLFSGQCAEKGVEYSCEVLGDPDDWYIGDSMKLRQVLINILGNAVKFTPEGGSVSFTAERTARFDGKSALRFVIRDTGIGMSDEFLPHIFETFAQEDSSATNRYGSSGLGLAITKNIVEMMNGEISVESKKGAGSTFTVTVTLIDSDHPADAVADFQPSELHVLVVDDDPVACEHAKLVLEKVGIACETVTSGAGAVEMVRLRHARRDPYRLILVDWKMPEMDGIETTRQIRAVVGSESAIIILTAYRWDEVYDEAVTAGVDCFLPKPLFASSIMEEFRMALARKNLLGEKKPNKANLKGRHILLAEDIAVNAEIIIMVLEMREMIVDYAENGRIAVEKFAASTPGYYDAVLMDMRMPEMDGLEATARIRAMDREDAKSVPIIALTANAFDEDVQRSLQAGLNAHLSKPVEPADIYATLESLIPE